jgi:spoIIIJ-associated protein
MEDRSIEVSAPDVEEAIEYGLAQLGLSREEAHIEIVDAGSRGLFGIGAREAIVRLAPSDQPFLSPAATEPAPEESEQAQPESMTAPEPTAERDPAQEADLVPAEEPEHDLMPETDTDYALSQDQVADVARQTLIELLDKMGMECQVTIRHEEPTDGQSAPVSLDIQGKDADELIGRQGDVLNALQYIARLVVSREVEHWVNLVVDVQRYKQRRAKSLQQLAERIAERVARTKQPVALEPMPPNERRVIHVALHDHPAVTTQSVGKGDSRKVTIIPRR